MKNSLPKGEPDFSWRARVFYEDTDAGGVVYYANYLKFLERARTEWLRFLGLSQHALMLDKRLAFVVRHVEAEYFRPARLDDEIDIVLYLDKIARSQLFFRQLIYRVGSEPLLLVDARVQVVSVSLPEMKIVSIPTSIRVALGL